MPPLPARRSRLAATERLLIDGTNLLHALRRGASPAPPATLIGRLRGVIEPSVRIELILDGPQEPGLGDTRIASGVTVRYSGRGSADSLIARLVAEAAQPATLLVVTDDGELADRIKRSGGRTARTEWLMARLDRSRLRSPSVGRPRPPNSLETPPKDSDQERPGWQPGRGATKKRGNPRRAPKTGPPAD